MADLQVTNFFVESLSDSDTWDTTEHRVSNFFAEVLSDSAQFAHTYHRVTDFYIEVLSAKQLVYSPSAGERDREGYTPTRQIVSSPQSCTFFFGV